MPKVIEFETGFTLVDSDDYDFLVQWKWRCPQGYAVRSENGRTIGMHRVITKAPDGMYVDHINGIPWDNRKDNLRVCEPKQNSYNAKVQGFDRNKSSDYKGVCLRKDNQSRPWRASIRKDGKLRHIGNFMTQEEAARAYDQQARLLFGKFAKLNFPD